MIADPRGYPQSFRQEMEFAQDHKDVMKADKIYYGEMMEGNASRQRIDLCINGAEYHFGIELAAGIENSKYKTYSNEQRHTVQGSTTTMLSSFSSRPFSMISGASCGKE